MKIVLVMLAVMGVAVAGALAFYAFPATDPVREVDAVVVLGPPTDTRVMLASRLVDEGLAGSLVISLGDADKDAAHTRLAAQMCEAAEGEGGASAPVVCGEPAPFTTRGEARWLRDLAETQGWDSLAIITVRSHVSRARVIIERCFDGEVAYYDSGESFPLSYWFYQVLYQTGGFAKVVMEDGC